MIDNISRRLFAAQQGGDELSVEAGDVLTFDLLGAFGLAGVGVGAAAKTQFIHLAYHLRHTLPSLDLSLWQEGEMRDLGSDKQHSRSVLAGNHTGTAAYAGGCVHGLLVLLFGHWYDIGIGHTSRGDTDIASRLDDFVESRTVNHKVFDDGEGLGTPWLYPDFVAVVEMTHKELAGGYTVVIAMGTAVDVKSTHTTNSFTTVVVETDRVGYLVGDQLLVEDVEHLKERTVGRDVVNLIGLKTAFGLCVLLTPNMQSEIHNFVWVIGD